MSSKGRKPTAAGRARKRDQAEREPRESRDDASNQEDETPATPKATDNEESTHEVEDRTVKRARLEPTAVCRTTPSLPDLEQNLLRTNLVGSYDRPYLSGALQGGQSRYEQIVRAVSQGVLNAEGPREMRSGRRYPMAPPPLPRRAGPAPQPQRTNRSLSGTPRASTPSTPSTVRSVSSHGSISRNVAQVPRNLAPTLPNCYVGVFKGDRGNVDDCSSTVSYSSGNRSNASVSHHMARPGAPSYLRYPRDATIPDSQPSLGTLSSFSSPARTAQPRYPRDATIPDSQPSLGTLSSLTGSNAAPSIHHSRAESVLNARRSSIGSVVPPSEHPLYRPPGADDEDDDRTVVAEDYSSFRLPEGPRGAPHGFSQADIERWLGATRSDSHSDAGSIQETLNDAESQVLPTARGDPPPVRVASRTPGVLDSRTFMRTSSTVYPQFPAHSRTSSHVAPSVVDEHLPYIDAPLVDISSHAGDDVLEQTQVQGLETSFFSTQTESSNGGYINVPTVEIPSHAQDAAMEDTQVFATPHPSSHAPERNENLGYIEVPGVNIEAHAADAEMQETQVVGLGISSMSLPSTNASSGVIDVPPANISSDPGDGDLEATQMCAVSASSGTVRAEGSGYIDAPEPNMSAHPEDGNLEATQMCPLDSSLVNARERSASSAYIDAPRADISAHVGDPNLEATQICDMASSFATVREGTGSGPYINAPPADISGHPGDVDLEATQVCAAPNSVTTVTSGTTNSEYIDVPPGDISAHPGDVNLDATQVCPVASSFGTVTGGGNSSGYIDAPPADISGHPGDANLEATQVCGVANSFGTVTGSGNSSGYIDAPPAEISAHPEDADLDATQVCAGLSSFSTVADGSMDARYIDAPPVDFSRDPNDDNLQDTQLCAVPTSLDSMMGTRYQGPDQPAASMAGSASHQRVLVQDSQDDTGREYIDAPPVRIDNHPEDENLNRTQVFGMSSSMRTPPTQRTAVGSSITSRVTDSFASEMSDSRASNYTGRQLGNPGQLNTGSIAVPYPEYGSDPRDADLAETQFIRDAGMDSKAEDQ